MASRNTVNLITELERRYLECNICTEVFDEDERIPRLLPCHHTFCSECLKRLSRRKDTIKCPTCNSLHKVKKNGPFDFPKDNTRRDLTSFLQAHSDLNAYRKCCECGNTVDITYKCDQCNINLCKMCRRQHITENKTHNLIVAKSEAFKDEDDDVDICQNPTHQRAKLKYFCNSANCQSVLCASCALDDHREISKHELEDIEEACKNRKKELGNDVKSLQTQLLRVESIIQKVQKTTISLQEERDEFHRNVYDIHYRNINVLEKRRDGLLDKYDITFQRKESTLVTRKDNLDSFLKNANNCCSLSEQFINLNSMSSFLNVHQTVDEALKMYLNTPLDTIEGKNELEENINFTDRLRLFKRSVEPQDNDEGDGTQLVNPIIGNYQELHLRNTINAFGKKFYTTVARIRYLILFIIKVILFVLLLPIKPIQIAGKLIHIFQEYLKNVSIDRARPIEGHAIQIIRPLRSGNMRHNARAYNRRHHDKNLQRTEQNQGYNIEFRKVFWNILLFSFLILVIPEIALIPLDIREHGKLVRLRFDTKMESQFTCRSADFHTVATVPFENMLTCGSTRRLFKFQGGFTNSTFPPKIKSTVQFSIRLHKVYLKQQESIFEFGLTNKSVSTKLLFPSTLSVRAFTCQHKFDLCLSMGNEGLFNIPDIFKSETSPYWIEARFILMYRPSDSTVFLLSKSLLNNTTTVLHAVRNIKLRSSMKPVFAAYSSDIGTVSITVETDEVGFVRNTLHQDLYISDDNRTMSNKKLSDTFPNNSSRTPVIFTRQKIFDNSNVIQTMINILFETNGGDILFKIGIAEQKNGILKKTQLLECSKCDVEYLYGLYRTTGFCLSDTGTNKIIIGNQLRMFLHYNQNGIIEMYIRNHLFGYSYRSFQFDQFDKLAPKFFIEKINAKDIIVSSIKHTNLINLPRLMFGLILGLVLLLFYCSN